MADNVALPAAAGYAAADEVSYSGQTDAAVQVMRPAHVTGAEGSRTIVGLTSALGTDPGAAIGVQGAAGMVAVRTDKAAVSTSRVVAAASTNATVIKASAGTLKAVRIFSVAAYPIYVKFHNTASTPTAGSGVVYVVGGQAGMRVDVIIADGGKTFATGIAMTVIKDIADVGNTAVAASDAVIEVEYV